MIHTASFLDQAKNLANQAVNSATDTYNTIASNPTVQSTASSISSAATNAANQAGPVLSGLATQTGQAAQKGFTQAQSAAHNLAPDYIPAATATSGAQHAEGSVDTSHDLSPSHPGQQTHKLEQEITAKHQDPEHAAELQGKNILKGDPQDALAGKKKDLELAMKKDKLEGMLEDRKEPGQLVDEGILKCKSRFAIVFVYMILCANVVVTPRSSSPAKDAPPA